MADRLENPRKIRCRERGRGAAAKKDGRDNGVGFRPRLDFAAQGVHILDFGCVPVAGIGVEVAVATLLDAKRNMDINPGVILFHGKVMGAVPQPLSVYQAMAWQEQIPNGFADGW